MEAVGRLDHPLIVRAMDAGEEAGTHFLVMEYVEGMNLSRLVRRVGPLPMNDACGLVRQAAMALQYAHEHGLVHRDIKPSNLILNPQGQVKVLDLGLARLWDDETTGNAPASRDDITATGQIMGTPDYIAPEQASDTHSADIRADIYSLGCTLYHLLAGHPPFRGKEYSTTFKKLMAHTLHAPPPLRTIRPDLPVNLEAILDHMLAKNPDDRFADPGEVAAALAPFTAVVSNSPFRHPGSSGRP